MTAESRAVDLSAEIAGITFQNPVLLASGTAGYGEEFNELIDLSSVGGIVVKGTSLKAMEGNPSPRLFPTPSGMLNSIGLQNVGVDRFVRDKMPFLRSVGCQVVVNVFGFSVDEYVGVIEKLNDCEGIAAYELNVSCPNTEAGGMVFGTNEMETRELVARVKIKSVRPIIVKLSPNVTDIRAIALAAEGSGADALTVANTYVAMAIDPDSHRVRVANVTAGLSGPAIRPITLRMVYECAQVVKIPIFGLGGISCGNDAVEYFLAGASAVQVGTASFRDPRSAVRIVGELERYLQKKNIRHVRDLVGKVNTHRA
jgi:dihydroorotate dehydrogenase (NAD+) catalytic subunit